MAARSNSQLMHVPEVTALEMHWVSEGWTPSLAVEHNITTKRV